MSVREDINAGKYENKVPYSIVPVPVDEHKMTMAQAKAHVASEKLRARAQKDAHGTEQGRLTQLVKSDLEAENGLTGHPMADKLWEKAWSHGHHAGYSQVVSYYEDFMELLEPRAV
jgi:hypothetical protein